MSLEYVIYADESTKRGRYYSDFYGGALVRSQDIAGIRKALLDSKDRLGLAREVKWRKVTAHYLSKYVGLMDVFLDLVARDAVKVRMMFTQNAKVPLNLTKAQRENRYFLLYYQFIKHAFGLEFAKEVPGPVDCRLYFDTFPQMKEKVAIFRGYLGGLARSPGFRRAGIRIREQNIAEVRSHDHVILQCLDVALGAMQFRLNDQHKVKPPGSSQGHAPARPLPKRSSSNTSVAESGESIRASTSASRPECKATEPTAGDIPIGTGFLCLPNMRGI